MRQTHRQPTGQILLITLLVLSIGMTVALSLIARTTTDVSISTQIEESSRAFSAAEAGIEEALKTGTGTLSPVLLTAGVTYSSSVVAEGGTSGIYQFPRKTLRGNTETLWLVPHYTSGPLVGQLNDARATSYTNDRIDLCWSSGTPAPALVATVLYKKSLSYLIAKGAYDPDASHRATDKFDPPTATSGGCGESGMNLEQVSFNTTFGINVAGDPSIVLLAIRLRPVYADAQLWVNAPAVLPQQGNHIESTGKTTTGPSTGVARKVVVYQQYPSPGSIFDNVIYSQQNFSQ